MLHGWNANGVMALASVVNVVLVFALAVFNYRYMKSAAEQAKAAHEQAVAALANIELLKGQIQEQKSLKLTEALVDFRHLQSLIKWWLPRVEGQWGAISQFPQIRPENWPSMFHIVEQSAPSQKEELLKLESHLRNAQMLIDGQLPRVNTADRSAAAFKAAANDLSEANRALTSVLEGLEFALHGHSE